MKEEDELLAKNLNLLLANSARILARPEWFHCRMESAYLAYSGGGSIPLGVLLLLWSEGKMTVGCAGCGATIHLVGLSSTPLGSSKRCWGVCAGCGRWASLRPDGSRPGFFQENAGAVRLLLKEHGDGHLEDREVIADVFSWKGLKKTTKKVKVPKFELISLKQLIVELAPLA